MMSALRPRAIIKLSGVAMASAVLLLACGDYSRKREEDKPGTGRPPPTGIDTVGGVATDERFWLIDMMIATLTWSQIQAVGEHPDVQRIESAESGEPPP